MSYIAHFWYFGFLWAACWALISVFGSPWSSAQTQQYAFQAPWDASLLFGTGDAVCTARQPDIEATYGPAGFTGITHTSTGDATPTSASSGGACQYQGTRFGATGQITQFSFGAVACGASGQAVCPVQHCTPTPGVTNTFSGTSVTMATSSYCNGVDDCQVNVTQSVGVDGQLIYTGVESSSDCLSGQPPVPAGSSSPAAPQCATGASGMTYCTNPTGGEIAGRSITSSCAWAISLRAVVSRWRLATKRAIPRPVHHPRLIAGLLVTRRPRPTRSTPRAGAGCRLR